MSLETELAANTAALTTLNETMVKHNEILSNVKAGAGGKPADKATDKPVTTGKAAGGKAADKKAETTITLKSFVADASAYLNEHKQGTAEFDERAATLKKIAQNFGVERLSGIPEANAIEANGFLLQIKSGEDPFPAEAEDGGGVL